MCYYSRRPSLKNSRINEKTALSLSERPPSPRDTSGLVRAIARADYVVHGRENVVADLSRETCLWATSPASQRGDDPVKEDAALLQKYGGSDRARRKRLASRKELRLVGGRTITFRDMRARVSQGSPCEVSWVWKMQAAIGLRARWPMNKYFGYDGADPRDVEHSAQLARAP